MTAKEKAAKEAAEEKLQRSKKLESDIIARVEAAENKITKKYDSCSVYYGQMEGGKRHGSGTMTWVSGKKYVGEWKNGILHGYGTKSYADGSKYVGEWKNGNKNGNGKFTQTWAGTWADGTISHSGEWENGKAIVSFIFCFCRID